MKMKKTKKQMQEKIETLRFFTLLFLFVTGTLFVILWIEMSNTDIEKAEFKLGLMESFSTCRGLESFYIEYNNSVWQSNQNLTFLIAVNDTLSYYNIYYNQTQRSNETFISRLKFRNFNDILNNVKGVDCEDISHMINCLAKAYNIKCDYYIYYGTKNIGGHRGIFCKVDGVIEKLY